MSLSLLTANTPQPCLLLHIPAAGGPLPNHPSSFKPHTHHPFPSSSLFLRPTSTSSAPRHAVSVVALCSKKMSQGMKEQKWTHEGVIVESLPNGMFRVRLDNEDVILGYISGKIRKNFIRMLPGDKVKIEVSRYDSTRGRIVYRLRNRDSGD